MTTNNEQGMRLSAEADVNLELGRSVDAQDSALRRDCSPHVCSDGCFVEGAQVCDGAPQAEGEWVGDKEYWEAPISQPAPAGQRKVTDLSARLRQYADEQPGWKPLLTAAADEIERYYGGMLAWKATAEAKDKKAIAATQAAPVPEGFVITPKEPTPEMIEAGCLALHAGLRAKVGQKDVGTFADDMPAIFKAMLAAAAQGEQQ